MNRIIRGAVIISRRRATGLTLVESLMAMVVLSIAILGITYTTTAGHQHLHHSDTALRAVRLAEHLLDEIASRPYTGSGPTRPAFHVDDYDGFHEEPNQITDVMGDIYGPADQAFSRTAAVREVSEAIPGLEGAVITGKIVEVTVEASSGGRWQLQRFIPEQVSP